MQRRQIASRAAITGTLGSQIVPLLLFPPESFSPNSQEWWLPVLLVVMVAAAVTEILVRNRRTLWPWHLMIFAQGFNIISRIMMMWAHATKTVGGVTAVNWPYLVLTSLAMIWSAGLLWYFELPEVRMGAIRD